MLPPQVILAPNVERSCNVRTCKYGVRVHRSHQVCPEGFLGGQPRESLQPGPACVQLNHITLWQVCLLPLASRMGKHRGAHCAGKNHAHVAEPREPSSPPGSFLCNRTVKSPEPGLNYRPRSKRCLEEAWVDPHGPLFVKWAEPTPTIQPWGLGIPWDVSSPVHSLAKLRRAGG